MPGHTSITSSNGQTMFNWFVLISACQLPGRMAPAADPGVLWPDHIAASSSNPYYFLRVRP
jgi:hypothetical protein